MRIRIIQTPPVASIDGIQLGHFEPGHQYEVGNSLGAVLLAEGWAEPVDLDDPPMVVPFSESDPFDQRRLYRPPERMDPSTLVRDTYPPSVEQIDKAAEFRRRRPRKRR
jgi:hypothetical protein